jgi:hypothetical protein
VGDGDGFFLERWKGEKKEEKARFLDCNGSTK